MSRLKVFGKEFLDWEEVVDTYYRNYINDHWYYYAINFVRSEKRWKCWMHDGKTYDYLDIEEFEEVPKSDLGKAKNIVDDYLIRLDKFMLFQ